VVEETVALLAERGYATIPDAISAEQVGWIRSDLEEVLADTPSGRDDFEGRRTRRVYALFAKTRSLDALALHPDVLTILDRVLGASAERPGRHLDRARRARPAAAPR
jgi:hypothetical protein